MAPTRSAIPYEDLQVLLEQKSLDYAYERLGQFDPARPDLGAVGESMDAKVAGGLRWWKRHGDQVKKYICESKTIRAKGPLVVAEAVFGTLVQFFANPLATYATVILIKHQFGSTINGLGKDAVDAWCGDIRPSKASRSSAPSSRKSPRKRTTKQKA
jgi:hypothetical protein